MNIVTAFFVLKKDCNLFVRIELDIKLKFLLFDNNIFLINIYN